MSIIQDALKREKLTLEADALPPDQRTVRVFRRLIAAIRAAEAEVHSRLGTAEAKLNEALEREIGKDARIHFLEALLMKQQVQAEMDTMEKLSTVDKARILAATEATKPAA